MFASLQRGAAKADPRPRSAQSHSRPRDERFHVSSEKSLLALLGIPRGASRFGIVSTKGDDNFGERRSLQSDEAKDVRESAFEGLAGRNEASL